MDYLVRLEHEELRIVIESLKLYNKKISENTMIDDLEVLRYTGKETEKVITKIKSIKDKTDNH